MVYTKTFEPAWKKYEKDITSDDPQKALEAGVKFDIIRQDEMRKDPKARTWEESRKAAFLRDKPAWAKQRIEKEKQEYNNIIDKYKNGGMLMESLTPSAGFILIKPKKQEAISSGGVFLPQTTVEETCIATVIKAGKDKVYAINTDHCPCKDGDIVLYRHDSGLRLTVKSEKLLLVGFSDILGIVGE